MPGNINVQEVKDNVGAILKVWKANPDFKLKDLTVESLQQDADAFEAALNALQQKEDELTPLRNQRDDLGARINAACTRARTGIKGYFGDNSTEYEQAGGTRSSEIKKSGRGPKPAPAPAPAK